MEKPILLTDENISLEELKKACQFYIDFLDDDSQYTEDEANDYEHNIFEKAIETLFGIDAWDFINNRQS